MICPASRTPTARRPDGTVRRMEYEEPPYPESTFWRLGVPAVSVVLAAVVGVALVTLEPGAARTTSVAVALALLLIGVVTRGLRHRRAGRRPDRPWLVQFFVWLWAAWAGVPEILPVFGDGSDAPARLLFALVFAVLVTGALWLAQRPLGPGSSAAGR
jgi:hypothetical protein